MIALKFSRGHTRNFAVDLEMSDVLKAFNIYPHILIKQQSKQYVKCCHSNL